LPDDRAELMLEDPRLLKSRVCEPRLVSKAFELRVPLVSRPPKSRAPPELVLLTPEASRPPKSRETSPR